MAEAFAYQPDYGVAPGETLRETIDSLGMTQSDLAARTGLSAKHVNQIIQGVAPLTPETAILLERVTAVPASFWNAYEAAYRGWMAQKNDQKRLARDNSWLQRLPLAELKRRGFVSGSADPADQLAQVWAFFGVADQRAWESIWVAPAAMFRKSPSLEADPIAIATWLRLGEIEAAKLTTASFHAPTFRRVLAEARTLTQARFADIVQPLVDSAATAGVAVVFIKDVGKTRASGAARWLRPDKAMIALSLRHHSDDHVWFSFFHEAGHLMLHSKKMIFVDSDDASADGMEEEANQFARNHLIPSRCEPDLHGLVSDEGVLAFAQEIGISPGIVVGRLQREGLWPWRRGNDLKQKVDFGRAGVPEGGLA